MNAIIAPTIKARPIVYPESDGQPMAENTLQFEWIVTIKEGLSFLFAERADVFIAGDLLWYPVEGDNKTCAAPDTMVAIGRPRGHRRSYLQWEEGGVAPQVVFEVLSPGNRPSELIRKFQFYERHGVLEYYIYDPDRNVLEGWQRERPDQPLVSIEAMAGWTSPRLGITFNWSSDGLQILRPDGQPFETFMELAHRAEAERQRAEAERQRAEAERQRAERLAARLRELGEDVDF